MATETMTGRPGLSGRTISRIILAAALVLPSASASAEPPPAGAAAPHTLPGASEQSTGPHPDTCPPAPDLSGLVDHMEDMAARLTGLDGMAALDAAAALRAYAVKRASLCAEVEALTESNVQRDRLIDLLTADRERGWSGWVGEIERRPVKTTRGPLGWNIGAGACVSADGELSLCGAAVWGFRF